MRAFHKCGYGGHEHALHFQRSSVALFLECIALLTGPFGRTGSVVENPYPRGPDRCSLIAASGLPTEGWKPAGPPNGGDHRSRSGHLRQALRPRFHMRVGLSSAHAHRAHKSLHLFIRCSNSSLRLSLRAFSIAPLGQRQGSSRPASRGTSQLSIASLCSA